jgi:hypothetical protein
MVLGAIQRKGKVKTKVIPQTNIENVTDVVKQFVVPNSTMVTDEHHAYNDPNKTVIPATFLRVTVRI